MKHSSITIQRIPLELSNSWPLFEQARHFELGSVLDCEAIHTISPANMGALGFQHAGWWECDLKTQSLTWSGGVYDLFGLERGAKVTRPEAVAIYSEESRAAMERLRAYAIKHRRGFTLDAEIGPPAGGRRWMRLIAAPVCDGDTPVRLHGLKIPL